MKWKKYFSQTMLQRGRSYYDAERVKGFRKEGNTYSALVMGRRGYAVEIRLRNEELLWAECSCPYAQEGHYCKHMAALFYKIEEMDKQPLEKDAEVPVHPFQEVKDGEYRYFDLAKMTQNLTFTDKKCEEARKLIEEEKVCLTRVDFGYEYTYYESKRIGTVHGRVDWQLKNETEVQIQFDKDRIRSARCYKKGCYTSYDAGYSWGNKELCVHELALLFLLDDYIKKYNPGDNTDYHTEKLLSAYQNRYFTRNQDADFQKQYDVQLVPRIEESYDGWKLSFQVGEKKLYVVKNLTNFVENVENQSVMTFGTKSEIDFLKHDFDETSQAYYKFIRKNVENEKKRNASLQGSYRYAVPELLLKGNMDLYGVRLDEFYELAKDYLVSYIDKTGSKKKVKDIPLRDAELKARLVIKKEIDENGIFQGIEAQTDIPDLVEGNLYDYYLTEEALHRIDREQLKELEPFVALNRQGNESIHVGRQRLADFYYNVVPMLEKSMEIVHADNEMEEISAYLPPEVAFRFYLDMEEEDITCKAEAAYGEKVFNVIEMQDDTIKDKCRNQMSERKVLRTLWKYFDKADEVQKIFYTCGEERAFLILEQGLDELFSIGEVHCTDQVRNLHIHKKPKISVGVSVESDLMNLTISSENISKEELYEVLKSYRKKKKYHRLKNGDFLGVQNQEMELLDQLVSAMGISAKDFTKENMKIPMYRALYLDKLLEKNEEIYVNRNKHFKKLIKEFKTINESDFEVPESLRRTIRKYQETGFKWLGVLLTYGFGGILADDMGLGKTLQMICLLLSLKENGNEGTSLIVAPASLVYNWQEEVAKFAPQLRCQVIVGNKEERIRVLEQYQEYDVLVTSYDLLKRDIENYEDKKFQVQVIDEAQYIKNHTTAAAKAVKVIQSRVRFALTGTPIENRLSELWSIFDYLMPGYLYGYETFRKDLETPIAKNKDEEAAKRLRSMIAPFVMRRLKEDVLKDLPEKMEEVRVVKFDTEQQQLYDAQVLHMKQMLEENSEENFNKNKLQILAELTKIRQICCDPNLLYEDFKGSSAKREMCIDLVRSAVEGGHKILIFSQFTSMLELLEQALDGEKISYYKIVGSTPKVKRMEYVKQFNEDDVSVFLISLKAGGTGLNLTGADIVIHYDPWWNLAVQNQATDRAHRIGQTRKVSVYKLIAKDSIEEKIVKMQELKKDLANEILNGEMGGISRFTREELMELIQ